MRDAAQFFKVLADEARVQMLWLLFNHEELCVCELMGALGITQSKASRHLNTLKHAGLVRDRKEGLWSYYTLCPADDELSARVLEVLRAVLATRLDAAALLTRLRDLDAAGQRRVMCAGNGAYAPSRSRSRSPSPSQPKNKNTAASAKASLRSPNNLLAKSNAKGTGK